ncbi:leucine-rich repeat and calponin homology domain-containing protein 3 isoform X2 [Sinocyclocheilus anshuiensis]|uniref:leucine-rich repeat and calponin homology domain-containing protein 3 isoform X2 n=1 Tax=Sinocyclocheilus anshuiensis TaxID=1608454 RepID=UPI0007BA0774|nr:PREDICTED: leucine-rich repeat and calponin homology domain-containing protein 3 isoform X2 [Sinocyclocheilus anshuiensis]
MRTATVRARAGPVTRRSSGSVSCVMAASVLLSAESAVPLFTVGPPAAAAAAGAAHHGLPSAPGAASWSRSLDRALDEAAATGALTLSGRKLKEFPRSAAGHDLTDTTRADLSRNRLTELPVEVCMFVSLESLNLYQNCLRSLPERLINLQSLTYLNISRNQLSTLPAHLCRLPLKVLIACNNKLVSLPEDLGKLRQLTELDVSCNEIQTLPPQIGQLEALRDLNIRRNHLVRLPPELAELPLVRLDFSCNKVTTIPVCYRNLRHLQSIILDNNPLQSPPAQICIKGKIHIFKYLNMEACKAASDLPDYDRRPLPFGSCAEDLCSGRLYGALDSGFNSVDSGDKRWSGNEPSDELSDLPLRVAEITREQRQRRDREREREDHWTGSHVTNGALEAELEQIDFIDSCTGDDEDEDGWSRKGAEPVSLSSQFMAYIERRITREGSPVKTSPSRDLRTDDPRRQISLHNRGGSDTAVTSSYAHNQRSGGGVERVRREAQLAALRYEEERQKTRSVQRDAVMNYVKHKSSQSPTKPSPTDSESLSAVPLDGRVSPTLSVASCMPQQGEDYGSLSPTGLQSPSPSRGPSQRPESYLFCLSQREEKKKEESGTQKAEPVEATPTQSPAPTGQEAMLIEQLRRNIECRLKVSLPSDLGAALTDGVVLCHLANHVRPRSIPSIHVPSPAVPKLTMAKCRRNVENFLEACRRIGVPQDSLCSAGDVLKGEVVCVFRLVEALLSLAPPPFRSTPSSQLAGFALFYLSIMSLLCALYCHLVPSL